MGYQRDTGNLTLVPYETAGNDCVRSVSDYRHIYSIQYANLMKPKAKRIIDRNLRPMMDYQRITIILAQVRYETAKKDGNLMDNIKFTTYKTHRHH